MSKKKSEMIRTTKNFKAHTKTNGEFLFGLPLWSHEKGKRPTHNISSHPAKAKHKKKDDEHGHVSPSRVHSLRGEHFVPSDKHKCVASASTRIAFAKKK